MSSMSPLAAAVSQAAASPLALFWAGYMLVLLVPGPNMLIVGSYVALKGPAAALPLVCGVSAGAAVLAAIVFTTAEGMTQSPLILASGRWLAFAMLVWIAWRVVRPGGRPAHSPVKRHLVVGEFGAGFVTAFSNPVTAGYFLAVALALGPALGPSELASFVASAAVGSLVRSLAIAAIVAVVASRGGGFHAPPALRFAAAAGLLIIAVAGVAKP